MKRIDYKVVGMCAGVLTVLLIGALVIRVFEACVVKSNIEKCGIEQSDDDYTKMRKITFYVRNNTERKESGLGRRIITQSDSLATLVCLLSGVGNCRETAATLREMADTAGVDLSKLSIIYANIDYSGLAGQANSPHAALRYGEQIIDLNLAEVNGIAFYDGVTDWLAECRLH